MFPYFSIDPRLQELSRQAEEEIRPQFEKIEEVQRYNQQKMLAAFNRAGVSESHFAASTGYGYGDRGRDVLDQVYAYAFGAEDAWCATTLSAAPIPSQLPYSVFCGRETRCSASRALPMIPFRVSLA